MKSCVFSPWTGVGVNTATDPVQAARNHIGGLATGQTLDCLAFLNEWFQMLTEMTSA